MTRKWNLIASRLNEILRTLKSEKDKKIPNNLRTDDLAIGLQIELAQAALISGRLAVEGVPVYGEPVQRHALVFRHTVDKGLRVIAKLRDSGPLLPRWGSHTDTPAPRLDELQHDPYTRANDWRDLVSAALIEADGNKWWEHRPRLDLSTYGSVKSADAARFWFRVTRRRAEPTGCVPEPDIVREIKHSLAWVTGVQDALQKSSDSISELMRSKRRELLYEFLQEYPNAEISVEDAALMDGRDYDATSQPLSGMATD